ncbi:hypothetical protein JOC94_002731 [Bacillus thermophilus]|uniref:Uncharacterized protein n=1 Tax=Siminovitchia thermophila TaxID=1245522 RepID=A0ABS2R7Z0_9BACI|nr:hypothetical protein [Siminovitchia thermophila]MBM7715742.1 hypothetical protein [Siminovitchia thermophila]ONK21289.1 hypothetical protein BLX87_22435 [Bacillus sp. VT-16-64]
MKKKQPYKSLKNAPKEVLEQSPTGYGFMSVMETGEEKGRDDQEESPSLYGMEKNTSLQSADFSTTDNPYFSDREGV